MAGSQAAIGIGAFGTRVNMTLGYQMSAPEVEFEAASKQIVVRDATVENTAMVVYEVRSFDAVGMPIGTRFVRTEVTSAEPVLVTLPISEVAVAKRYDLMTYYMREDPQAEDAGAYSRLTNLTVVDEETGELGPSLGRPGRRPGSKNRTRHDDKNQSDSDLADRLIAAEAEIAELRERIRDLESELEVRRKADERVRDMVLSLWEAVSSS